MQTSYPHRSKFCSKNKIIINPIPSPISILVFFALKTHNILCAKVSCRYYILCVVKSKRQIFNFGEGIAIRSVLMQKQRNFFNNIHFWPLLTSRTGHKTPITFGVAGTFILQNTGMFWSDHSTRLNWDKGETARKAIFC